jgi:hypothetical protein
MLIKEFEEYKEFKKFEERSQETPRSVGRKSRRAASSDIARPRRS